jgi:DNA-binding beta-propeller fold protein YncE
MRRPLVYGLLLMGAAAIATPLAIIGGKSAIKPGWNSDRSRFTLFNGWKLTPAGRSVTLPGDMPTTLLFVDGGKRVVVNTSGFHDHSLNLVDIDEARIVSSIPFERTWIGLTRAKNGDLLFGGGKADDPSKFEAVHRVSLGPSGLRKSEGFSLPGIPAKEQFVSTLLNGPHGTYVLNAQTDEVFLLSEDGKKLASTKVGYRPYGAVLSPDGTVLAVSNWGDRSVSLLSANTLDLIAKVAVESHPTAVAYGKDGRLFVTNAGANTMSVIEGKRVVETVQTGIDPVHRIGATPLALAISDDGRTAYVANAGNNCVAVLDISNKGRSKQLGFIPTERYPTALALTPDGKRLLIGTAKGFYGPNAGPAVDLSGPQVRGKDLDNAFVYIGGQLTGRLTILDVPDRATLGRYTKQVRENAPAGLAATADAPERKRIEQGAFKKIKHVIYVIKENRTYDQVLGDIPKGNGDKSLAVFGEKVTPNEHKLANGFVLLDNLYADGEVSQVGHQWTDAAYGNDYCEKQWILNYSRRGEIDSDPRMTSSPGEYIWTLARKHGHTARVYGEYVDVQEDHDSLTNEEVKKDPEKYGYSASFEAIFARDGRDTEKVADFLREMREAEQNGKWPELMVMALPEDHTNGFSAGRYSPYAMVANNDLAVGQLIEGVSHSKFWNETAIFVIQDDAQSGPDHVDSHRTVGLLASPYVRRGFVDHTMYSTSSMLRTIELILGLPPMTEYDAKATPMYACFTTKADSTPYTLEAARVSVNERNPSGTALAKRSSKLDFSEVDRADFGELNRILWEGYRPGVPYPESPDLRRGKR